MTRQFFTSALVIIAVAATLASFGYEQAHANHQPFYIKNLLTHSGNFTHQNPANYTHPDYVNDTKHPPHIYPDHFWNHPRDMEPTLKFEYEIPANDQPVDGGIRTELRVVEGYPEGAIWAVVYVERHRDPSAGLPLEEQSIGEYTTPIYHENGISIIGSGPAPSVLRPYFNLSYENGTEHYVMQITVVYKDADYNHLAWGAFKHHIPTADMADLVYRWDLNSTIPAVLNMTANQTADYRQLNEHVKRYNDHVERYESILAEMDSLLQQAQSKHDEASAHRSGPVQSAYQSVILDAIRLNSALGDALTPYIQHIDIAENARNLPQRPR